MATDYKIRVYNSGVLKAEFTDFIELDYLAVVNGEGKLDMTLKGFHDAVQYLIPDALVEAWRTNLARSVPWYKDFSVVMEDERRYFDKGVRRFDMLGNGLNSILARRIVNWPANVTSRTKFVGVAAETIMKLLVDYNIGPSATVVNGRKRSGVFTGLSIATDQVRGSTHNYYCHGKNLLTALQEIALMSGNDFQLDYIHGTGYVFEFYPGQLGTDRTATQTFSLARGNMGSPDYQKIRSTERTVAAVWGQGDDLQREYVTVTGDNFSASNDREVYVDAREIDFGDTTGLQDKGEQRLKTLKSEDKFAFDVIQTPASFYGKHYFRGDRVTAKFDAISIQPKIVSVAIGFRRQRETINVDMDTRL